MAQTDLSTLAAIAGHSKYAMTQRYVHVAEQHKAKAMTALDAWNQKQIAEANAKKAAEISPPHKNAHSTRLQ